MMRTKMKENEDWQKLKNTIRPGDKMAETAMNFQEKADTLIEKQDELLNKHFKYIREVAQLLKTEGQILTKVKHKERDDETHLDDYISQMESIV